MGKEPVIVMEKEGVVMAGGVMRIERPISGTPVDPGVGSREVMLTRAVRRGGRKGRIRNLC